MRRRETRTSSEKNRFEAMRNILLRETKSDVPAKYENEAHFFTAKSCGMRYCDIPIPRASLLVSSECRALSNSSRPDIPYLRHHPDSFGNSYTLYVFCNGGSENSRSRKLAILFSSLFIL